MLWALTIVLVLAALGTGRAERTGPPGGAAGGQVTVAGPVRVIDGDTIKIGNVRIRLFGIDAPEIGERCGGIDCGQFAKVMLARLLKRRGQVVCASKGADRYGRAVSVCWQRGSGKSLGGWMVQHGHARAARKFSKDYVLDEAFAATMKFGFWKCSIQAPRSWRREKRALCKR